MNKDFKLEYVHIERGIVSVSKDEQFLQVVYTSEKGGILVVYGLSVEELLDKMKDKQQTLNEGELEYGIIDFMIEMTRKTNWEEQCQEVR